MAESSRSFLELVVVSRLVALPSLLIRVVSILCKLVDKFDVGGVAAVMTESRTSGRTRTRTNGGGYEHG